MRVNASSGEGILTHWSLEETLDGMDNLREVGLHTTVSPTSMFPSTMLRYVLSTPVHPAELPTVTLYQPLEVADTDWLFAPVFQR